MKRVFNFSAGPSVLPEDVLREAQAEMLDYKGSGMSVLEMSHRSSWYEAIIAETEALLREQMNIPENYKVLFLQGGASTQFYMIPMNLMKNKKIDFIHTGAWSKAAIKEAKMLADVNVAASSEDKNYNYIPEFPEFRADADYVHIVNNNTIYGTRYTELPDTKGVPLVGDMSSNILSEPVDVTKYGLIFAGAQKNLGPAGVTIVIIREDLVGLAPENTPSMINYKTHVDSGSMFNTPACYSIYLVGKVLKWVKNFGGIDAIYANNLKKANMLYDYLDSSDFFRATVEKKDRSLMNVPFLSPNADLDKKFVKEAEAAGLVNLKGHRSVGGMRASIYNAMPVEGVATLVDFMKKFAEANK
ncbi:MAG: 3-phosphoserine/phosphohydroxythreonine transaminase [Spirochaetales bacterium]|nr:3-phosphoserine/phosphohydroxythreonine transaminase [Spirochaetales bacterium]